MKRSTERYLTTHVGSLIRPESIRAYNESMANDEPIDQKAYEATLKSEVAKVVRQQADAGVDVISDGEFGKPGWTNYLPQRITGIEVREIPYPELGYRGWDAEKRFKEYYELTNDMRQRPTIQYAVVGPLKYTEEAKAMMRRDVANFKAALASVNVEEGFLPVVAVCSWAIYYKNEYYKTEEEMLFAVAEALNEEYKIITDAGLVAQLDDAILANKYDMIVDSGLNYRKWCEMMIEATNHGLRGIPEEQTRYHLCWGSWPGPHMSDVPLSEIIDLLLTIKTQGYSIEAANPRHEWEWELWKETKLPEGKVLIPGMVSHAASHVEHPRLIAQRIERFANVVGPENVIASTDCGFAQGMRAMRQHPTIMWAKLEALAEGARIATARLKGIAV
jgi:5-methyltetrahydropteroyltriglutamate--homocysteine methyltransferase